MNLIKSMLIFAAVIENRSITAAAKKLFITPTAVSKQIKQLEQHVGQSLLIRTTRKVEATELGQRFYQQCLQVQQGLAQTKAFIEQQHQEPQGKLTLLVSVYFMHTWLIHQLTAFRQRYPKIELAIDVSDRQPDLAQEHFDLILGFRQVGKDTPQLRQRPLETSYFVLAASPDYLQQHGTPKKPKDLEHHQLINHPARQPINLIRFRDGQEVVLPSPMVVINQMAVLMQLCCEGNGILLLAARDAAPYFASGQLLPVLPKHPLEPFTIYAFYRATPYEQQNIRCLLDFLSAKLD